LVLVVTWVKLLAGEVIKYHKKKGIARDFRKENSRLLQFASAVFTAVA
jgi:hypothetical protein